MTDTIQARLRAWALQPETDGDGNRVPFGFCDECNHMGTHRPECPRAIVLALLAAHEGPGTCETCKHWWSTGGECWHPQRPFVALALPDTRAFGCTLHDPKAGLTP